MKQDEIKRQLDSLGAGVMCACILGGLNLGALILVLTR